MPVSPDVMEIVRILDEEGFGLLASELLGEVTRGVERDTNAGDADLEGTEITPPAEPPSVHLDDANTQVQRYFDLDGGKGEPPPRYESIPERDQVAFAMEFLHLRLVEPIKHLAEAERLAGELASTPDEAPTAHLPEPLPDKELPSEKAIRIAFAFDPIEGEPFGVTRIAGSSIEADNLGEILQRISAASS